MTLDSDVDLLRQASLLGVLDEGALRLIAFSAQRRSFSDGAFLYRMGSEGSGGMVVVSGTVDLMVTRNGQTEVQKSVSRGAVIGELAMIAPVERSSAAVARGDVAVLVVSRQLFRRVLEEYPESAAQLHGILSERLRGVAADFAGLQPLFDDGM